jgi:hypothetical protein
MKETKIGKDFKSLLIKKTGEDICEGYYDEELDVRIRNIIQLLKNFDCYVYYLTSNKGFWNFIKKAIPSFKKNNKRFVIVFLTTFEKGYLMHCNDVDKYLEDFSISQGYCKITERYLRSANILSFRTIDEFVGLLLPYHK